jgi:hypothetical protein
MRGLRYEGPYQALLLWLLRSGNCIGLQGSSIRRRHSRHGLNRGTLLLLLLLACSTSWQQLLLLLGWF